ncbi:MAG: tetratricopeptide repeat protein [Bryobacteraceae bacterium]
MTRHELKEQVQHDHFLDTVDVAVDYVSAHRRLVTIYGAIAVAVVVIVGLTAWYMQHQKQARRQALNSALEIVEAPVSAQATPYGKSFPTKQAKDQAAIKVLSDVASKYSGSEAGDAAQYFLGTIQVDNGKYAEAEKNFKTVGDSKTQYSAFAKVALAELFAGQGKLDQAKTILDGLIQHPTPLISKNQATLLLAGILKDSDPARAKQLAESLKGPTERAGVQRAADQFVQGIQ